MPLFVPAVLPACALCNGWVVRQTMGVACSPDRELAARHAKWLNIGAIFFNL